MLQKDLENLLIEKCSLVFHSFFDRDMKTLISLLHKDFVWIGSYDFQYTEGIDEFIKITKDEQNEDKADVYDETYQILTHTNDTYVVYGRFSASALKDNNTFLFTKQRATYVWKYINDEFKLLHEEIIYINIEHRTATIHTASQVAFDINKQLVELMEMLPSMVQCHKSCLVNPKYITKVERYKVTLLNNEELPIGKSRYDEFRNSLKRSD